MIYVELLRTVTTVQIKGEDREDSPSGVTKTRYHWIRSVDSNKSREGYMH